MGAFVGWRQRQEVSIVLIVVLALFCHFVDCHRRALGSCSEMAEGLLIFGDKEGELLDLHRRSVVVNAVVLLCHLPCLFYIIIIHRAKTL